MRCRASFATTTLGTFYENIKLNFCSTPHPRFFSPHNTLGFGDLHNVLLPSFPNDRNGQGSILFPKRQEPIHASFPNGPGHIPVAVGGDNKVLEEANKQPGAAAAVGHVSRVGLILLT